MFSVGSVVADNESASIYWSKDSAVYKLSLYI